jgi:putative ABC transport system permease protein
VSAEQADQEVHRIARDLENEYPTVRRGWSSKIIPMRRELLRDLPGRVEKSLLALLAAVGFLLLICCANVAGLLMARGVVREREIAVRQAMGAGWARIVRQLLTESMLLATLGGLAGLALAYGILPLLASLNPVQTTAFAGLLRGLHVDARALMLATALTLLTGVISGFLPAIKRASVKDLMPLILEGHQRSSSGTGSKRTLSALVVAEMAVAIALLVGGALMIQSFQRLKQIDVGFRPEGLLTMHMELSPAKYTIFPQRVAFVQKTLDEIRKIPGVVSAGITTNLPLTTFSARDSIFAVEGHPSTNPADVPETSHRLVSPEYLQTLGLTLIEGRLLNENDRQNTQPVVVISEELARQGWGNEDPLGKHIKRIRPGATDSPWFTVVGVVKNLKEDRDNFRIDRPVWYLPYEQQENDYVLDLVVRVKSDPASFASAIRQAILAVDPDQPVSNVVTMKNHLEGMLVNERFSAILMAGLAAFGVLLAIVGLYGVMAYSVSRQTCEIGLRVALGATPASIFKMVLARGAKLIILGVATGLAAAVALTRLLAGTLYGIRANDPATFAAISLLLMAVAIAACYVPARRAMRVDPIVALKYE